MMVACILNVSFGINRIRLEFKGHQKARMISSNSGINRIRLEFKAFWTIAIFCTVSVLIESDWNLKLADMLGDMIGGRCINGIRLEFKSYLLEKDMKSE